MKKWLAVLFALISSSAVLAETDLQWQAPEHQQHFLTGRVWQADSQEFSTLDTLLSQLKEGSWLLLGEQHDHPDHHQIQSFILTQLARDNRLGSVAFEMANSDQQALLNEWLGRGDEATPEQLNWSQGWPWQRYASQVIISLNEATAVIGADLPRAAQMHAYQQGAAEGQLDDAHSAFMMELIFTSHCEMLPRANLPQMLQVQLGRDQHMAAQMLAATRSDKVNVLIAGSMHVRNDLGIPRWLSVPTTSVTLMPLETIDIPEHYLADVYPGFPRTELSSDFLLFTPAMPEQDHCAAFQ